MAGLSPVMLKRPAEHLSPWLVSGIKLLTALAALTIVVAVVKPGWLLAVTPKGWLLGLCVAVLGPVMAWFFYLKAMANTDVSLVSPGTNSYPVVGIITDLVVYGVVPKPLSLVAAAVILAGLWFLSADSLRSKHNRVAWLYIAITAVCWGVNNVVAKALTIEVGILTAAWLRVFFASAIITFILLVFQRKAIARMTRRDLGLTVGTGLLHDAVATTFFMVAMNLGPIYIVSPLSAISPLFAAFLSGQFLHEAIGWKRWLSIFLIVGGVALMALLR